MNVNELIESGAHVDIRFFDCAKEEDAIKKLLEFSEIGEEIKFKERNGIYWAEKEKGNLRITAFYDEKPKK